MLQKFIPCVDDNKIKQIRQCYIPAQIQDSNLKLKSASSPEKTRSQLNSDNFIRHNPNVRLSEKTENA